jgi:serine/threonine-protein kinase haspin
VSEAFKVRKVAEGSYGEVFKLDKRGDVLERPFTTPRRASDASGGCIFKLIPLRAKSSKSSKQTSLDSLVREVQLLKLMDPIPGFARFRELTVLQGRYPSSFAEAYYDFKARKGVEEAINPPPDSYKTAQLWAMIEMDDAGLDLEILRMPSTYQIFDIFWLACVTLSYGEELAEFEVCIHSTN